MAIAFALGLACAFGLVHEHEITKLPGWDGTLPSKQYSGYLKASQGRQYHYWYVESERSPATDPLVLWVQGGPGASSMTGMFTEMGPFFLNEKSLKPDGSVPTLFRNPYTWAKNTNIIFWESPAGVGFSKCDTECPHYFDNITAEDNYQFLLSFFAAYPELRSHKFFLTGESYAGVYIPTLVEKIRDSGKINLTGFAIGNGCMGTDVSVCGPGRMQNTLDMLYSHHLFSSALYGEIQTHCRDSQSLAFPSAVCVNLIKQMSKEVGAYNNYDIYDSCGPPTNTFLQQTCGSGREWACALMPANHSFLRRASTRPYDGPFNSRSHAEEFLGAIPAFECGGGDAMAIYLNHPEVKTAIHVDAAIKWPGPGIKYTRSEPDLIKKWSGFIRQYRVLIFSGDFDAQVPYIGTEEWTSGLGLAVKTPWQPWLDSTGAVGGSFVTYDIPAPGEFQFLTIRAAGHMVPTYQPVRSAEWFDKWINQKRFG